MNFFSNLVKDIKKEISNEEKAINILREQAYKAVGCFQKGYAIGHMNYCDDCPLSRLQNRDELGRFACDLLCDQYQEYSK